MVGFVEGKYKTIVFYDEDQGRYVRRVLQLGIMNEILSERFATRAEIRHHLRGQEGAIGGSPAMQFLKAVGGTGAVAALAWGAICSVSPVLTDKTLNIMEDAWDAVSAPFSVAAPSFGSSAIRAASYNRC